MCDIRLERVEKKRGDRRVLLGDRFRARDSAETSSRVNEIAPRDSWNKPTASRVCSVDCATNGGKVVNEKGWNRSAREEIVCICVYRRHGLEEGKGRGIRMGRK